MWLCLSETGKRSDVVRECLKKKALRRQEKGLG